jgi:hypothetical protein
MSEDEKRRAEDDLIQEILRGGAPVRARANIRQMAAAEGHVMTVPSKAALQKADVAPCWFCSCGMKGTARSRQVARDEGIAHLRRAIGLS